MNELALFAGVGGGILGGKLIGWRTVCAVECDTYARAVLIRRQNEGHLPPFPIWDDVRTFDGTSWEGIVDVVSGGFPCQDISSAGNGAGIDGERSGRWREMARIVGEVRPRFVLVENSPMLIRRGLARVVSDLSALGYDSKWSVMGADDFGAPHRRKRIWILGSDASQFGWKRLKSTKCGEQVPDARLLSEFARAHSGDFGWWKTEPEVGRVVDGMAYRVEQLRAIGNGQVPIVAKNAWRNLVEENND